MTDRPTFGALYLNFARELSRRSTCSRLQVGCVITSADFRQVYAIGYNGNYSGGPNQCDSDTPGACGCIHSEVNAVVNCAEPRGSSKVVFVSHSPCLMCAKVIINLGGVMRVVFGQEYRLLDGVNLLRSVGISVRGAYTAEAPEDVRRALRGADPDPYSAPSRPMIGLDPAHDPSGIASASLVSATRRPAEVMPCGRCGGTGTGTGTVLAGDGLPAVCPDCGGTGNEPVMSEDLAKMRPGGIAAAIRDNSLPCFTCSGTGSFARSRTPDSEVIPCAACGGSGMTP